MNLESLHISRTVAVIIFLVVVVGAAVAYTVMQDPNADATVTVEGAGTTASEANFITLASELDAIRFDTTILSDPRFLSLQNINTAITPEPVGREDPFGSIR